MRGGCRRRGAGEGQADEGGRRMRGEGEGQELERTRRDSYGFRAEGRDDTASCHTY